MVDPRDLGLVSQIRSPHHEAPTIYLYEAVPGGVGLSERLWKRHDELLAGAADLIAACACDAGCPACTGPRLEPHVDAKALALRLLGDLGRPPPTGGRRAAGRGNHRMIDGGTTLARRLERYRAADARGRGRGRARRSPSNRSTDSPSGMADRDGRRGHLDRRGDDRPLRGADPRRSRSIASGSRRLPGQPPPGAPLVCLDTETTGLATAAGTVAWLIGLGWWETATGSARSSCCCPTTPRSGPC